MFIYSWELAILEENEIFWVYRYFFQRIPSYFGNGNCGFVFSRKKIHKIGTPVQRTFYKINYLSIFISFSDFSI